MFLLYQGVTPLGVDGGAQNGYFTFNVNNVTYHVPTFSETRTAPLSAGGGGTVDTIVPSTGISVDATDPANPIVSTTTTLSSAGGFESLVSSAVNPTFTLKGLSFGSGITLSSTGTAVTITNSDRGSDVSLSSAGGTETLVNDGVGPTLATKGITAGTGIALSSTASALTIINSDPGSDVSLSSAGGTESLVNDGIGPALFTKGVTAGTGIALSSTASALTIINSDKGSDVTLSSAGGTETLVNDGVGPALATKGITAGTGIALSSTASALTVTNSAPDQTVTLTPSNGLTSGGAYPALTIGHNNTTTNGFTGLTSYTTGDILYASAANTLSKLAAGTNGYVLTMGASVPAWSALSAGGSVAAPFVQFGQQTAEGATLYWQFMPSGYTNCNKPFDIYWQARYVYGNPSLNTTTGAMTIGFMGTSAVSGGTFSIQFGHTPMTDGGAWVGLGSAVSYDGSTNDFSTIREYDKGVGTADQTVTIPANSIAVIKVVNSLTMAGSGYIVTNVRGHYVFSL